eukprot:4302281-Amphidinium_carterae.1
MSVGSHLSLGCVGNKATTEAMSTTDTLMRDIGDVILSNALDGFNGCLFAYGQQSACTSSCSGGGQSRRTTPDHN